jgi:hypothetical protein
MQADRQVVMKADKQADSRATGGIRQGRDIHQEIEGFDTCVCGRAKGRAEIKLKEQYHKIWTWENIL